MLVKQKFLLCFLTCIGLFVGLVTLPARVSAYTPSETVVVDEVVAIAKPTIYNFVSSGDTLAFTLPAGWKHAFSNADDKQITNEFVKTDDSTQGWREMITVQLINGAKFNGDASAFTNQFMVGLEASVAGRGVLSHTVLRESPEDMLAIWKFLSPPVDTKHPRNLFALVSGQETQEEIVRCIKGKYDLFVIHYAAKKPFSHNIAVRKHWLDWINSQTLSPKHSS